MIPYDLIFFSFSRAWRWTSFELKVDCHGYAVFSMRILRMLWERYYGFFVFLFSLNGVGKIPMIQMHTQSTGVLDSIKFIEDCYSPWASCRLWRPENRRDGFSYFFSRCVYWQLFANRFSGPRKPACQMVSDLLLFIVNSISTCYRNVYILLMDNTLSSRLILFLLRDFTNTHNFTQIHRPIYDAPAPPTILDMLPEPRDEKIAMMPKPT